MTLVKSLSSFKTAFDQQLVEFFTTEKKRAKRIDPFMVQIISLLEAQVMRGGKRIRPFLAYTAYQLSGGKDLAKIIKASLAVELVHQFILMHDDIADRDEKRYGHDTLHNEFNKLLKDQTGATDSHLANSLAMGAGDHLYGLARSALYNSGFPDSHILKASNSITDYLRNTIAGWALQFTHLKKSIDKVTEADYLKSTTLVTAYYTIEGPLLFGTILSDNNQYNPQCSDYALHVGLAFQIRDDILGMFGDTTVTGKPVGNDFREGKKTSLILRAYQNANSDDKLFIKNKLGTNIVPIDLKRIQKIITDTASLAYTTNLAQDESLLAKKALVDLPESTQKQLLLDICDFVTKREK